MRSDNVEVLRSLQTPEVRGASMSRFVVLYYSHVLTTIPVPLVLLILHLASPFHALSVALPLVGFWTLVGAVSMVSLETRQLRRLYLAVGAALVAVSVLPSL
jgi:hypothetical protein